jgi:hypothetical protein
MIFIYLAFIFILVGLSLWIAGAVLHKKSNFLEKKKRKKQQKKALFLGTVAKIILIVASFSFIMGIMMLHVAKIN